MPASASMVTGKGEGAVSISFTDMFAQYHRLPKEKYDRGHIRGESLLVDLTYGLTDKVAIDVGIPFVVSKYAGDFPHETSLDDETYHGTFQDFRVALRYNLVTGPLVVTPFVGSIVPSHAYEYSRTCRSGPRLRELLVGTYVARRLDPILPGGFLQARYSYAFTERVLNIDHNRSVLDVEVGYFVKPSFRVFALGNAQRTHGGVDSSTTSRVTLGPLFPYHDQITRDNHFNLGGGAAFSLNGSLDLFGSVGTNISGRNGHAIKRAITLGMAWSFGAQRGADLIVRGPAKTPGVRATERTLARCVCQKAAS